LKADRRAGHATNPDSFRFTRNLTGFEDVNVYYNVDKIQRWIQSLGFTNIQNLHQRGRARPQRRGQLALRPFTNRIAWGDGGVDMPRTRT